MRICRISYQEGNLVTRLWFIHLSHSRFPIDVALVGAGSITRPFTGYLQNPSIIPKKLLHQLWKGVEQRNLGWSVKLEIETLPNFINDGTDMKWKYRRRGKTLFYVQVELQQVRHPRLGSDGEGPKS